MHSLLVSSLPKYSIITATFNSEFYLERTADSLRAQTCNNFEWIIIDGQSSDKTVERIQSQGSLVSQWISEKDNGISDAWNKGLKLARGQFILILNAGDTYDLHFLECLEEHIGDGKHIVCSHARLETESGEAIGMIRSQPSKLYRAMHLAHNWCAVPIQYYHQLGGYSDLKLSMDFEWFHRFYRRYGVDGFNVIDVPLGAYRLGGLSDVKYYESFRTNTQILINHGMPIPIANFWRWIYTCKHACRFLFQKRHQ